MSSVNVSVCDDCAGPLRVVWPLWIQLVGPASGEVPEQVGVLLLSSMLLPPLLLLLLISLVLPQSGQQETETVAHDQQPGERASEHRHTLEAGRGDRFCNLLRDLPPPSPI